MADLFADPVHQHETNHQPAVSFLLCWNVSCEESRDDHTAPRLPQTIKSSLKGIVWKLPRDFYPIAASLKSAHPQPKSLIWRTEDIKVCSLTCKSSSHREDVSGRQRKV
jgi:hypothetical protein